MANAKIENLLNLALDASEGEREKSLQLGVGYSPGEQSWEVIVRFIRDGLERVGELLTAYGIVPWQSSVTVLTNSYAIIILPEALVDTVAGLDEIIYMENQRGSFLPLTRRKGPLVLRLCSLRPQVLPASRQAGIQGLLGQDVSLPSLTAVLTIAIRIFAMQTTQLGLLHCGIRH